MINTIKHAAQEGASKCIKAILVVGTTLFITLNVWANPTSAATKKELKDICKQNPDKEIVVKVEDQQSDKIAKFESTKDSIQDPYDQIKSYVDVADTEYFMQLKKYIEIKDSSEQIKCKAVIYAILQDTTLSEDQKKVLALAYFERLVKMPWSNYRFRLAGNKKYETNTTYGERRNWYSGYKSYLDWLALDEEAKKLDKEIKSLQRRNNLLQQLLDWYNKK